MIIIILFIMLFYAKLIRYMIPAIQKQLHTSTKRQIEKERERDMHGLPFAISTFFVLTFFGVE